MQLTVEEATKDWPKDPKESAGRLIETYGQPNEISERHLVWLNTPDGWKRTVLSREEIPHDFPAHHMDYLEQFIDYKVPVEMYSALAEYDGSVMAERTKGELSARCGGTSMNFVAINLAHEIITGQRTVAEAREEYGRLYQAYQNGEKPPATQKFLFELPKGDTKDPDTETLKKAG
jgi:hypothetical protein